MGVSDFIGSVAVMSEWQSLSGSLSSAVHVEGGIVALGF